MKPISSSWTTPTVGRISPAGSTPSTGSSSRDGPPGIPQIHRRHPPPDLDQGVPHDRPRLIGDAPTVGLKDRDDGIEVTLDLASTVITQNRRIRHWRADEGWAPIAPIQGVIPQDGIDVPLSGKERRCTRDAIREWHRRGKLLRVISDREPKLGTNFPVDSLGADLMDRFSVVHAVPRKGRGFRVVRVRSMPSVPRQDVCLRCADWPAINGAAMESGPGA